MTTKIEPTRWVYRPLLRPASFSTLPEGLSWNYIEIPSEYDADRPDLLIGTTHGKYIARDEDLPFLRLGFPIIDRCGHTYFPTVGYRGAMRLLEKMLDLFLDRKDRDSPEEKFELVL